MSFAVVSASNVVMAFSIICITGHNCQFIPNKLDDLDKPLWLTGLRCNQVQFIVQYSEL